MPLRMHTEGQTVSFKVVTREGPPACPVPKEGRELTMEQLDTAAFLVGNALGGGRIPFKKDRELAHAAQEALMVFLENLRRRQASA